MTNDAYVQALLMRTVQIIVSHPNAVVVECNHNADRDTFIISADPHDVDSLGGNDGQTAHSLNIIVGAIGRKFGRSMSVEIDCRPLDFTRSFLGLMRSLPAASPFRA